MNIRFFNLAAKLSKHSTYQKHPIGAVITTKKGRILGTGFNKSKTHVKSNNSWKTIHAELSAILNSRGEDLKGAEIYIFRSLKNGQPGLSKSCKFCEQLLKEVGIKKMHYSTAGNYATEEI